MKSIISFIITMVISSSIFASSKHVGIVVRKQGNAEILTHPSKKVEGKGPHVLFNGIYYQSKKIRLGTRIHNGNVVRTGAGTKLKVVFKNGDQYNIGEGTAYNINWKLKKNNKKEDPSTIDLMYGSIRGVISKRGPRSGVKIRTKHAIMGIRGTDFHIGQKGSSGKFSVSVLRGKVEVKNKANPKQILQVEKGFSAELNVAKVLPTSKKSKKSKQTVKAAPAVMQLLKTTKNELVKIQKDSKVEKPQKEEKISKSVKKELANLEVKAVENTMQDIKQYDPTLYKVIKDKKLKDVDSINTIVISKIFEKAPVKKQKAGIDNLDFDESYYDKYFKIDE